MVAKIFEVLLGVKKASNITKATSVEAIDNIVNEVNNGNINPVEAYVMLDYLTKVTAEALKNIKPQTLDHIQREGDNSAFGVQLNLVSVKDYSYEEDPQWIDIERKAKVYIDARKSREDFLKKIVNDSIDAGKEPIISYTTNIQIRPKNLS